MKCFVSKKLVGKWKFGIKAVAKGENYSRRQIMEQMFGALAVCYS